MKKLFFTAIALSGIFLFSSCGDHSTATEQEQNEEIIQETEDDLLNRIEEEEASTSEDEVNEAEEPEESKAKEGVTEVDIKTLKN